MKTSIYLYNSTLLLTELMSLNSELKHHYPEGKLRQVGALRDIQSVFLAIDVSPLTGKKLDNPIRHSKINLLSAAAELLGKTVDDIHYAYYAVIPPMKQIYPHIDVTPYYESVNRYQIFFDLTEDQIVIQEGSTATSNSIVSFNPKVTHSFLNKSNTKPWRFVVFDIYK